MKKTYCLYLLLLLCLHVPESRAQQSPQFTQYVLNPLFYNPAVAGMPTDAFQATLLHRSQWVGYENSFDDGGTPTTQLLTASMPLPAGWGAGLHLTNDRLGPVQNMEVQLSFAKRLNIAGSTLSVGLRAGAYMQKINYNLYRPKDGNDPVLIGLQGQETQWSPDVSLGVAWQSERLFLALSATHLVPFSLNFGIDALKNTLSRNVYLLASYKYPLTYRWEWEPMLLVRTDLNTYSIEGGMMVYFDERYWGGLSYRQGDAAALLLGTYLTNDRQWSVGYAFDYTVGNVQAKSATSHEFMVRYTLPIRLSTRPPKQYTPRFYF